MLSWLALFFEVLSGECYSKPSSWNWPVGMFFRWLDQTPTGRILTRCTQDIRAVDNIIPRFLLMLQDCLNGMLIKLGAIILFTPIFVFPAIGCAGLGMLLGHIVQKAQLSVKRKFRHVFPCFKACVRQWLIFFITSNAKAPILTHFNAVVHGLGIENYQLPYADEINFSPSIHSCVWCTEGFHRRIAQQTWSPYPFISDVNES